MLTNPFTATEINAFGLYGQLEYDLTEKLTLVGGLRLNYEKRDFYIDYSRTTPPGPRVDGKLSDTALIPSVGVNYKATPDILVYARISQGYQAPGYNGFVGTLSSSLINTFDAEKLIAYEAGVKSQFLDRRVTLNVAGFYYDYSDLQVRAVFTTSRVFINNAASSTVKGVEASLAVQANDYISFSGQATYMDATYDKFCEPITAGSPQAADPLCSPGIADRSGNRLNQAPKWSGGVTMNLRFPMGDRGDLTANLTYAWESNVYFTPPNEPIGGSGGWDRIDARVAYPLFEKGEVYAFGKNLTNERFIAYSGRATPLLIQAGLNDPRTYGVGLRYHF